MQTLRLEYPLFPEEIQIAEKQRVKYFEKGDRLPKKYCSPAAPLGRYIYRKDKSGHKRLFDWETKEFVVANPHVASRPRFAPIAGNKIMRMHEGVWQKIVNVLIDFFITRLGEYTHSEMVDGEQMKRYRPLVSIRKFPVKISTELHTFPRFGNWDLSNLWIYNKAFEDAMQRAGVIPNDNIGYISAAAAPEFFPVTREQDRKIVFVIVPEDDRGKLNHLFYARMIGPLNEPYYTQGWAVAMPFESFELQIVKTGNPGDLILDTNAESPVFQINVGKTEKLVNVEKALRHVSHQCIQLNRVPMVSMEIWNKLEPHFRAIFLDNGIPVYTKPDP